MLSGIFSLIFMLNVMKFLKSQHAFCGTILDNQCETAFSVQLRPDVSLGT